MGDRANKSQERALICRNQLLVEANFLAHSFQPPSHLGHFLRIIPTCRVTLLSNVENTP